MRWAALAALAVLAVGGRALAEDGSVEWPVSVVESVELWNVSRSLGADCPPPMVHCDPCSGWYMRCCYYVWYPRGVWYIYCEPRALFCWWQPCDAPIPTRTRLQVE